VQSAPARFKGKAAVLLALSLFALPVLSGCGVVPEEAAPATPRPAKLMTLEAASSQRSNSLPAVVRSRRSTDLAFQVGGQILEWNAVDGQQFARGDVIGRLDDRSFKANVARAEAQYNNAKSEYERALRLIEEDAISRSVVEAREAQLQVADAALDDARKQLSDTVLRAPFSGGVGRSNVEQFQNVAPQQPVLILQSRAVEAVVNVPGSFVAQSNTIRYFGVEVELDAAPGRRFPAQFSEAVGQADNATQTFEAHFTFTPSAELLVLTGMTATLYFEVEDLDTPDEQDGVAVPLTAIMAEGSKKYVWVVKGPEKQIERREVQLGDGLGEMHIVTGGLKVGDTIVAAGGAYLQAGDRVRPLGE